jgi:hypothetical protein
MENNFDIVRWNHLPGWWNDCPKGDARLLVAAVEENLLRSGALGQSDTIGYIRQLAVTGDSLAIPVLKKALRHERRSVRTDAALALHALGGSDAVPALISDLRSSTEPSDIFHIVKALECIRDSQAAAVVAQRPAAERSVTSERSAKAKSGCFVATAACGDAFAPEVILLSAYRDEVLLQSRIGRTFVRVYYAMSPPIALTIVGSARLRVAAMRLIVTPATVVVARLWNRKRYANSA